MPRNYQQITGLGLFFTALFAFCFGASIEWAPEWQKFAAAGAAIIYGCYLFAKASTPLKKLTAMFILPLIFLCVRYAGDGIRYVVTETLKNPNTPMDDSAYYYKESGSAFWDFIQRTLSLPDNIYENGGGVTVFQGLRTSYSSIAITVIVLFVFLILCFIRSKPAPT